MSPWKAALALGASLALAASGLCGASRPILVLAALAWLALMFFLLRRNAWSRRSRAGFASVRDLASSGMFQPSPTGLIVGEMRGKLMYAPGRQGALLVAPNRSGKSAGIAIPNLLSYQGSIAVLDVAREYFDLTSGWRQQQGQAVYRFDPLADDGRTHRWNPLHEVSDDPALRLADLTSLAEALYPSHWGDSADEAHRARQAFVVLALYLFEQRDTARSSSAAHVDPTLGQLYRLVSGEGIDLKAALRTLSRAPFLSDMTAQAFDLLLSQADEIFALTMDRLKEPLRRFANPVVDAATSGSDFLLTDLRKKPMTIYVALQPHASSEANLLANLLISQLVERNSPQLPPPHPESQYPCLMLLDEFTALGRVNALARRASSMAGDSLRLFLIFQSLSQLDAVYGKETARALVDHLAPKIIYTPREQSDAEECSAMIGDSAEEGHALMPPQALRHLSNDEEVIVGALPRPVMCGKIRYHRRRFFTRKLLPKAEVPTLPMGVPSHSA